MNSISIDNKVINGLKAINYSVEDALMEFILLNLSERISKFKTESELYHKKYNIDFKEFQNVIESRKNEENFEEYEDYLAWKFAEEQKEHLNTQLEKIK